MGQLGSTRRCEGRKFCHMFFDSVRGYRERSRKIKEIVLGRETQGKREGGNLVCAPRCRRLVPPESHGGL